MYFRFLLPAFYFSAIATIGIYYSIASVVIQYIFIIRIDSISIYNLGFEHYEVPYLILILRLMPLLFYSIYCRDVTWLKFGISL